MIARDKIHQIVQRFEYLEAKLGTGLAPDELASLSKEYSDLKSVAEHARAYLSALDEREAASAILDDPEMAELARDEIAALDRALPEQEAQMRLALIPKDAADARPAIVESRPGTGGAEAALFAGTLWRMYLRYAEGRGWKADILSRQETELGGLKELTATIKGEVVADDVVINGRIVGRVRGLKVRLTSTARVEGDIIHKTIAIESGAHFEGSVQRQDDPLNPGAKAAPAGKANPAS